MSEADSIGQLQTGVLELGAAMFNGLGLVQRNAVPRCASLVAPWLAG